MAVANPYVNDRARKQKAIRLRRHRGETFWATPEQVDAAFAPWERMGLSRTSLAIAARCGQTHPIVGRVRLRTYNALVAVTEDDLPGGALVYAELTRRRIYSLMAAGHRLRDLPVPERGTWRYCERVHVDLARTVRAVYRDLEFTMGTSGPTATRARNLGHRPPLAWDDPDTLAWPNGEPIDLWPVHVPENNGGRPTPDVDAAVIERFLAGDDVPTTRAEREAIVARWRALGRSLHELEARTGWKAQRYYEVAS